jgi:hypothetical protein
MAILAYLNSRKFTVNMFTIWMYPISLALNLKEDPSQMGLL